MSAVRDIAIDFTSFDSSIEVSFAGYQGEHNATQLNITPPQSFSSNTDIKKYRVVFKKGETPIEGGVFTKTSTVSISLFYEITLNRKIGMQLEGIDNNKNLIAKTPMVWLYFDIGTIRGKELSINTNAPNTEGGSSVLVTSVNGKKGDVYLTAEDIGAVSQNYVTNAINNHWSTSKSYIDTTVANKSLPSTTSSDNGKILQVVNGSWAKVLISYAEDEEGGF